MLLSIIIPVYNEAAAIPVLLARLSTVLRRLDCDYEVVFVNDGSKDETGSMLRNAAAVDSRVKVLEFSRNFVHQAAITAGLDFASGDAAVIMDADLQDPPELIPEMLRLFRAGYDVVSAQRQSRRGDSLFKRWTAELFYSIMRRFVDERLQPEVGDFRLFSRPAILALRKLREQHRFMRGMVAWLGLKEAIVPCHRESRVAGSTKYPLTKMLRFAWTAITSFSALPLRATGIAGMFVTVFGVSYLMYTVIEALLYKTVVPGWTSLVCLQIIFSGALLVGIGLVGDYVARIYEELKGRPLYVVSYSTNVPAQENEPDRYIVVERPAPFSAEAARVPLPLRKYVG